MSKKKHGMLVYRENPAEHGPRQSQPSSAEGGELITSTMSNIMVLTLLPVAVTPLPYALAFFGSVLLRRGAFFTSLALGNCDR